MREKLYLYCPPRYIPPSAPTEKNGPCLNERIDVYVIVNLAACYHFKILLEYQFFPKMFKQVQGSVNEYEVDIYARLNTGHFFRWGYMYMCESFWGRAPDPDCLWGAYSAPPHPLAGEREVPRPLDESAGWKRRSIEEPSSSECGAPPSYLAEPPPPFVFGRTSAAPPPPPPSFIFPPPQVYSPSAAYDW